MYYNTVIARRRSRRSNPKSEIASQKALAMTLQKGASIIEYSLLIAVVAAALLGMQIYLKRGVSGKWKEAGDVFGFGRQYGGINQTDVSNHTINTTISPLGVTTE